MARQCAPRFPLKLTLLRKRSLRIILGRCLTNGQTIIVKRVTGLAVSIALLLANWIKTSNQLRTQSYSLHLRRPRAGDAHLL